MGADQNSNQLPVVGVGAIVIHRGAVLLVQRGKPPHQGEWAIPGGRLRWGETLKQGAEREILEETGITIKAGEIIYPFEQIVADEDGEPEFHYLVIDLVGDYISGRPEANGDAADARWVALDALESVRLNLTTQQALNKLYTTLDPDGKR